MRTIMVDRSSVCMGDDCMPHKEELQINSRMKMSELLTVLSEYVPTMHEVVWAVCSGDNVCGYIITDKDGNSEVEVNGEDKKAVTLIEKDEVVCVYYYLGRFRWTDGETGELVEKYPECETLLEKVKKNYE